MSPRKPLKPCKHPECPELTDKRFCEVHKGIYERKGAGQRGYDTRWRRARERFLKANPLCVECLNKDSIVDAMVVDHVVPHRGNDKLFWDETNWQALCKSCHDKKTMTADRLQEYKY
ncbi:HNH endonuclease signature motif containing protein [Tissierella sp.]|uniref:HNH endonuclease n=1 Tax=Tissierella sp. TaxID=41274 RepID=UPI003020E211